VSAVIGIHDGHNATAALVRDGKVELILQEERFTRVKNQGDAPAAAAQQALALAGGGTPRVALNGLYMNYGQWARETVIRDYERSSSFTGRMKQPLKNTIVDRVYQKRQAGTRAERLGEIGLNRASLEPVEHHTAHAAAAYYTAPWRESQSRAETLVLTCDGSGDRLSASVSIGQGNSLRRIAEISEHDSIGRLYALVTRLMGMVPLEHEYKVMGLAPYAGNSTGVRQIAEMLCGLFEFTKEPMIWRRKEGVPSMYSAFGFLKNLLAGQRFDWIAGGAQRFIETMLTTWVRHAVRETGIRRIACSGGVFMNVKANMALLEMPEVEDFYVFPSCGDESNSVGAAVWLAARSGQDIAPLGGIYYGEPITDGEAQLALETAAGYGHRLKFRYTPDIERRTAQELAEGKIVARAKGAAEFGARALGNRSILARADSPGVVRVINEMVKNRDFWMPFAPSVLAERVTKYCEKPKPVSSPYMMFAMRSRPEKRAAFAAAQHPYDFTARPHEVRASHNPDYHRMLSEYESITGEAIVLNTSFNLHGEPIVHRASDAVDVFLRSGLERLALANWWVEKTGAS
jgi:carbamoyltransferase